MRNSVWSATRPVAVTLAARAVAAAQGATPRGVGGAAPADVKAARRLPEPRASTHVSIGTMGVPHLSEHLQEQLRNGRLLTTVGSEARVVLAARAAVRQRQAVAQMATLATSTALDSDAVLPVVSPALGSAVGHLRDGSRDAPSADTEQRCGGSTQCSTPPDADVMQDTAHVIARQHDGRAEAGAGAPFVSAVPMDVASEVARESKYPAELDVRQDAPLSSEPDSQTCLQVKRSTVQSDSDTTTYVTDQNSETKEQVESNTLAETTWLPSGIELELSPSLLSEWSQRLHSRPTFERDGVHAGRRCFLGAGAELPGYSEYHRTPTL